MHGTVVFIIVIFGINQHVNKAEVILMEQPPTAREVPNMEAKEERAFWKLLAFVAFSFFHRVLEPDLPLFKASTVG